MSETIDGQYSNNEDADFFETSDPSFYEESGEGEQVYLDSVLPHEYDSSLEPFNTFGTRPKVYPEQTPEGFHPKINNEYQYTYNNTNVYFQPQNRGLAF
jgi:hypothetical protein